MPAVPLVLTILYVFVLICCTIVSVLCIKDGLVAFGSIFVGFAVVSVIVLYDIANYESQYEWVLTHKPTCTEETVECLTEQIEWVHDSILTASKLNPERVRIINTVNSNDSTHILLLKNNLNNLRNQNKKEN